MTMDIGVGGGFIKWKFSFLYVLKMSLKSAGIPWFTLLMWGHKNMKRKPQKQKPRKSRLLSSTKGEENMIDYKPW